MKYANAHTGTKLTLDGLNKDEKKFYRQALKRFHENTRWLTFEEFAFGMKSPIYRGRDSHLDVLKDPLFRALQDMSLQLGVQQGVISRKKIREKSSVA